MRGDSSPPESKLTRFARPIAGVALGVLWLLLVERLAVVAVGAGSTPLTAQGYGILAGGLALAHVGLLVVAGVVLGLSGLARRLGPRWLGALVIFIVSGALVAWPVYEVAQDLTAGDWVSRQSWAPALRWGLTAAGVVAVGLVGVLHQWLRHRVWPILLLGASAAFAFADAFVLPGLYQTAHVLLFGFAVVFAFLATQRLAAALPATAARGLGVAGLALTVTAPLMWRAWEAENRAGVMLASPAAANALPLVTRAGPASALRVVLTHLNTRQPDSGSRSASLPPRAPRPEWNLVLVLVDTLRVDAFPPLRGDGKPFAQPGDTPFLDAWLQKSFYFTTAYAQATRTMYSMPALLRSVHPFEDAKNIGRPVSEVMAERGRTPVAVVPQYFMLPMDSEVQGILDGFRDVAFYEKDDQKRLVPLAREVLGRHRDEPFFAWIHFFNVHAPGYAGELLYPKHGDAIERYRMSLKWLDGQMKALIGVLDELGVADRTIVVFASDHGESLGERGRTGHGGSVAEPEIRVPLAFYVPGEQPPAEPIGATVGNIDIMPTLLDLVGAPPAEAHRGRSLRPLMADPNATWDEAYSITNGNKGVQGLVVGQHKWQHRRRAGVIYRFDVQRDPEEKTNRYSPSDPIDQQLTMRMYLRNTELAAAELADPDQGPLNRQMVLQHLQSIDGEQAASLGRKFSFLLRLVALAPSDEALAEVERLFDEGDDAARLAIMEALARTHGYVLGERMRERLKAVAETPAEIALLDGLAMQNMHPFERPWVKKRMLAVARTGTPETLDAWLGLVRDWPKPGRFFTAPLSEALAAVERQGAAPERLQRVLAAVANLKAPPTPKTRPLARAVVPHLDHADPLVAIEAANALGALRHDETGAALRGALLPSFDPRVRQAALRALTRVEGPGAIDVLVEQGADPLLTVDAVQLLGSLGKKGTRGLPFLRKVARSHYTGFGRRQARAAIREILGEKKPKGRSKKKKKAPAPGKGG